MEKKKFKNKPLIYTTLVMALAFTVVFGVNVQTSNPNKISVNSFGGLGDQDVECYYSLGKSTKMLQCGTLGCEYPDGTYCNASACFNSDGTETNEDLEMKWGRVGESCLNEEGEEINN
ncbi:hypothetical protein COU74_00105 [Candidatus Peregrinibacteria bacterium CG10_big_fil_rev_8_21_14_0_10_36_19]|nr:MAG: hypothetical protein COU74_00105 [Candidatus Peregrinibacteria bacterium CG10_big_fil_rev_8_21_14_0_10_36_19]